MFLLQFALLEIDVDSLFFYESSLSASVTVYVLIIVKDDCFAICRV